MKKNILFFSLLIFALNAGAQSFQWARQFDARMSYGTGVVTDSNFNVISVGWFRDSVDLDPGAGTSWNYSFNSSTVNNGYISKVDANGNFIWGHTFSSSNYNLIQAVDVDDQDNIVVMGRFRDSVDLDFGPGTFWLVDPFSTSSVYDNIFIAKYTPAGNLIWGRHLHNTTASTFSSIWGHGMKVDAGNNVIVTGSFRDTVDFDPGPGVFKLYSTPSSLSSTLPHKYLLKLDVNGNFVWALDWHNSSTYNNSNTWWGNHELDVDANDNIFLPISFRDTMDIDPSPFNTSIIYTQGNNSLHDVSLLKIGATGALLWHKEIGGVAHDYCHSLATDPSGNIFYSINSYSGYLDMDPGPGVFALSWPSNQWRKIILKLDNNGNFIWALNNVNNTFNSNGYNEGIATDTAGGVYLTSRIWPNSANNNLWDLDPGPGAYMVSSAGSSDVALQSLDKNGQFIWGGVIGGSWSDYNSGICTDHAHGVYLTGYFNQTADFDPTPDTSNMTIFGTSYNGYLVKLSNCNKYSSQVYQNCDSVVYNNIVHYQDTVYQVHYPAANGCDSAHSVVIDVQTGSQDTIIVDTCNQYVWNNITYTSSGMYTQVYNQSVGCDSTVTLDLTIGYDTLIALDLVQCDSAVVNGVVYYQSGNYQQQYTNVNGCDSNYSINFTKLTADTTVMVTSPTSLQAVASNATYQWIDCATMQPIAGATANVFLATYTGSFACVVTQNGCVDTSSCYSVVVWPNAVNDYSIISRLYPNPSTGTYQLELDKNYQDVQLEIRTISGQLVWHKTFAELKETTINIEAAAGVYMLYIKQADNTLIKKMMKW